MKKFAIAFVIASGALGLSACGSSSGGGDDGSSNAPDTSSVNDSGWFEVHHVPVDGKTVTCLKEQNEGSISCDWANAR